MLGVDALCALVAAWMWKSARIHAGRLGRLANAGIQASLDKLEDTVQRRLSGDSALAQLKVDAESDRDNPRTRQRLELALQEIVEDDQQVAHALRELVGKLEATSGNASRISAGRDLIHNSGSGTMAVHTGSGDLHMSSEDVRRSGGRDV